ncbi:restriction endonuclease subunit S [Bacillus paranthracis]|uniref:restriction endonuclease subunit S n=1 Tax=Bacillus paranthracis TaxID=2026186 RepID=UPI0023B25DEA|nr:restriction endonuclease subunit S [Bacillus paranthracis]
MDDEFTFASYLIRLRLMEKYVDNGYINYVINSNWYRISQIEPGIVQQNGQANFNGTKLKNTLIPLPPLNEQKRIVKRIDQLMTLCDELENNINVFKQEKEYLLHSVLYQIF